MRTIIITFGMLFGLAIGSVWAQTSSETRNVGDFSSLDISSVGSIIFTQSDVCSVKLEGTDRLLKNTTTTVTDGTLVVGMANKSVKTNRTNDLKIYITAPDLKQLVFSGVGSFSSYEAVTLDGDLVIDVQGVGKVDIKELKCHDLRFSLNGVGSSFIRVECDLLIAEVNGVGSASFNGTARKANFQKNGVGTINRRYFKVTGDE
ncbi:MAG: DUF2807 domain-containing protein [Prevotellaceae bacterium]|jgi:hypothetical protein|nr:DUF2807 domain-containing protein [Prevotellaceae bacterium]